MVAPLVQLQRLEVRGAERLNARVVVTLQHMLPGLQWVKMYGCAKLLPSAAVGGVAGEQQQQREAQALAKVQLLLRPGLVLEVV
jgi:hypothetical protein